MDANDTLLRVRQLRVQYGSSLAVKDVSLEVRRGEIRAILGANGAGKTTILKTIMGLVRPAGGQIESPAGRRIDGLAAHRVASLGIALVPEGRQVLAKLTVHENLEMGGYTLKSRGEVARSLDAMYARFPRLAERRQQLGGSLSGGEQQMLAIARGLMSNPRLLLLDEPSLGLAPLVIAEVFELIGEINAAGTTVLLVEQNARRALEVANRAYVLQLGQIVLEDTPANLAQNEAVKRAYLGG